MFPECPLNVHCMCTAEALVRVPNPLLYTIPYLEHLIGCLHVIGYFLVNAKRFVRTPKISDEV